MKLADLITAQHISLTSEPWHCNPNAPDWGAAHYRCKLRCGRRSMTVYFSMGSAHTKAPDAADVLDCLASDASTLEEARGFLDWCAETGSDTDSRKAEQTYKAVVRQTKALKRLLTPAVYDTLLWDCERL